MIEVIVTFTIDDIEHNEKFRQLYDIINGDPAQLVKEVSWAGINGCVQISLAQTLLNSEEPNIKL